MPATRDGKLWRSQFYYKDWQGVRRKKNKRGFKTKGEADEWERNFLQQQQKNLDISFENFVEIYFADMENRLRESTIINMENASFTSDFDISLCTCGGWSYSINGWIFTTIISSKRSDER